MKMNYDKLNQLKKSILIKFFILICCLYLECNASEDQNNIQHDADALRNSLQNLDSNVLHVIFDFLQPDDFSKAVNLYLTKKQMKNFPKFQVRKYGDNAAEYFPHENGTHFFPSYIKQMFILQTHFSLYEPLQGSNFLYITLSHEGLVEMQFDGQIDFVDNVEPLCEGVDSLFFGENRFHFPETRDWQQVNTDFHLEREFERLQKLYSKSPNQFLESNFLLIPFGKTETRYMKLISFYIPDNFSYHLKVKIENTSIEYRDGNILFNSILPSIHISCSPETTGLHTMIMFHVFDIYSLTQKTFFFLLEKETEFSVNFDNDRKIQTINYPAQQIDKMPFNEFFAKILSLIPPELEFGKDTLKDFI